MKDLRDAEKAQQEYEEAQARWEQDKLGCESELKDGSSFLFVNADRNYAPVGLPQQKIGFAKKPLSQQNQQKRKMILKRIQQKQKRNQLRQV